jgi:hypothetical protein
MDLEIYDKQQLHAAAMKHAVEIEKMSRKEAYETLGTERAPDTSACLVMLLDPGSLDGCSIYGSSAAKSDSL